MDRPARPKPSERRPGPTALLRAAGRAGFKPRELRREPDGSLRIILEDADPAETGDSWADVR